MNNNDIESFWREPTQAKPNCEKEQAKKLPSMLYPFVPVISRCR